MPSLHREGNQPARIANHSLCPAGSFFPTSTGEFLSEHDKVTFAAMACFSLELAAATVA